jgi:hypothetical protein
MAVSDTFYAALHICQKCTFLRHEIRHFSKDSGGFLWTKVAKESFGNGVKNAFLNAPGGIRTSDPRFRKPVLYPSELRALKFSSASNI